MPSTRSARYFRSSLVLHSFGEVLTDEAVGLGEVGKFFSRSPVELRLLVPFAVRNLLKMHMEQYVSLFVKNISKSSWVEGRSFYCFCLLVCILCIPVNV